MAYYYDIQIDGILNNSEPHIVDEYTFIHIEKKQLDLCCHIKI